MGLQLSFVDLRSRYCRRCMICCCCFHCYWQTLDFVWNYIDLKVCRCWLGEFAAVAVEVVKDCWPLNYLLRQSVAVVVAAERLA